MVVAILPLICISSIFSFLGGFFIGDWEARQEIFYYRQINRNRYIQNETITQ